MIAIDLREQQGPDADPKSIQQINFTGNIIKQNAKVQNININTTMFFFIEESKEAILDFSQGTVKVLWMCSTFLFCFNLISI